MYSDYPTVQEHARRLGATHMPLAAGEVAEYRRPRRIATMVAQLLVLAGASWFAFIVYACFMAWIGKGG